jgi:hypothetical protein
LAGGALICEYFMNFFKRFFKPDKEAVDESAPGNIRLIFLLNNWGQNMADTNYKLVMKELLEGNSFLILPTINDEKKPGDWTTANEDTKLKLTSVRDLDGLKVLGAFSDEKSLLNWSNTPTTYTAVKSQAVLEMCKEINVNRIVINSGGANMFVIERNSNAQSINIKAGSTIQIGTPAQPLDNRILQNLISNFQPIENILEAYQFIQSSNNEPCITVGIRLLSNTDNSKKAVLYAVQNALANETNKTFVDMLFLDTEEWYDKVKNIEDALFYKKM